MVTTGKVRVVRFFSKAPVGAQLNWSVREKECYGIFYGVRLFEDLLDKSPFILKTDHKNLTYLNVTLTGKILRWKLYLLMSCSPEGGSSRSTRRPFTPMRKLHANEA